LIAEQQEKYSIYYFEIWKLVAQYKIPKNTVYYYN